MNIENTRTQITDSFRNMMQFIATYRVTIMIIIFGAVVGFTLFRINNYATVERDEAVYSEKTATQKVTNIDLERVQEISERVSDSTTVIMPNVTPGRINPFAEQ